MKEFDRLVLPGWPIWDHELTNIYIAGTKKYFTFNDDHELTDWKERSRTQVGGSLTVAGRVDISTGTVDIGNISAGTVSVDSVSVVTLLSTILGGATTITVTPSTSANSLILTCWAAIPVTSVTPITGLGGVEHVGCDSGSYAQTLTVTGTVSSVPSLVGSAFGQAMSLTPGCNRGPGGGQPPWVARPSVPSISEGAQLFSFQGTPIPGSVPSLGRMLVTLGLTTR